jgi:hypothetical protein
MECHTIRFLDRAVHVQYVKGGVINRGIKWLFQYMGSYLIEAYGKPEKYWLVCVRLLANYY